MMSMVLGGRDTAASGLSSTFWILARRPSVVSRIRTELEPFEGKRLGWEDVNGLKYLTMVLKEGMRQPAPSKSTPIPGSFLDRFTTQQ